MRNVHRSFLALALAGCSACDPRTAPTSAPLERAAPRTTITTPSPVDTARPPLPLPDGFVEIATPPGMDSLWQRVGRCSGLDGGDFKSVRWIYYTKGELVGGGPVAASVWQLRHIMVASLAMQQGGILKHEMLHIYQGALNDSAAAYNGHHPAYFGTLSDSGWTGGRCSQELNCKKGPDGFHQCLDLPPFKLP